MRLHVTVDDAHAKSNVQHVTLGGAYDLEVGSHLHMYRSQLENMRVELYCVKYTKAKR